MYVELNIKTEIWKDLFLGIRVNDFGGREIPQSAFHKLNAYETQWCNSVWAQRIGNQGNEWCKAQSEVKRRRDKMLQLQSEAEKRKK